MDLWPASILGACVVRVLRRGRELAAAVWFEDRGDGIAALHAHAAPAVRGRWLTPANLRYLAREARAAGFVALTAVPLPEHRHYALRLGFEEMDGGLFLPLYTLPKEQSSG
ncbi:hypothetical protein C1702_00255 [Caldimonas thermodepolymerans]|uniref:GNAT family N-acetyltransferase n=1 Tax=Caldimonas thermodepolymerans TaxID=215580 RepID=A0A2S5T910_9BURK|nr:hypothetical protein C1702_00255 [Caldimonas thermodepolymerans]